jgi:hypothetical protein
MQAGQQDGSIRQHNPKELSLAFWAMVKGLALHKAVYGAEFKAPDVRIFTRMFFTNE